jgi:hypothetical protein
MKNRWYKNTGEKLNFQNKYGWPDDGQNTGNSRLNTGDEQPKCEHPATFG